LNFYVGIKTGDILSYSTQGSSVPNYNKVVSIDSTNRKLIIAPTTSVSEVCSGSLPAGEITTTDLRKITLDILQTSDAFLYSRLNRTNIASLNLTNSSLTVRKSYPVTISSGSFAGTLETDLNLTLEPFDEEDYNLSYINTGSIESLDNQKLLVSGRTISLDNLSENGPAVLTVTYKKANAKVKTKQYSRCSSLIISKSTSVSSGVGRTTLNDGLEYNPVYGLRVQDKVISINTCDVESILGIYESADTTDPVLPRVYFSSLNSNIDNFIKGEKIIVAK